MLKKAITYFTLLTGILAVATCTSQKVKNLDPVNREFLSVVRYLITRQERKIFLNLPAGERAAFREEFWRKRDPDPGTEVNEFKEEYFGRIETANNLFRESTTPGWLQDRGRIYILLGPPDGRNIYPQGYNQEDPPMEVWYYGFFPIYFVDEYWSGDYHLTPQGAYQLAQIQKTQMLWKPQVEKQKVVFDFITEIERAGEGEATITLKVPYKNIWMKAEGDLLKTTLELSVKIIDPARQKTVWEQADDYLVSVAEEKLVELSDSHYIIEVPVRIQPGNYRATITLVNVSDEQKTEKKIEITV